MDKRNLSGRGFFTWQRHSFWAVALFTLLFNTLFPVSFPSYAFQPQLKTQTTLDSQNLIKCWENLSVPSNIAIASDNKKSIYLLTADNKIQAIDSKNGKANWIFDVGGKNSALFVSNNSVFIAGSSEVFKPSQPLTDDHTGKPQNILRIKQIYIRSFSAVSGLPEWYAATDIKEPDQETDKEIDKMDNPTVENQIYIGQKDDDTFLLNFGENLFSAEKNKSSIEWLKNFHTPMTKFFDLTSDNESISLRLPKLFGFYGEDKRFYLITSQNGEIIGSFARPQRVTSAILVSRTELVVGDEAGNTSLISFKDKINPEVVWTFKAGASVSSLSATTEGILVTSLDNFVYLIKSSKGNRIWKKRLSGRILYQPLLVKKENSFVVVENESAYFINLKNGAVIRQISLAGDAYFTGTPVAVNNLYIFPTSSGLVSYTSSRC